MFATLLGLVIGLGALALGFGLIEHCWPAIRRQRSSRLRPGTGTDLAWFFWDPLVNKTLGLVSVVITVAAVALLFGVHPDGPSLRAFVRRNELLAGQPAWLQVLELFVLFDLIGYWSHRFFHRRAFLWRFHAVHHSSMELDWLSSVRVHPVNEIGQRVAQAVPLVLLGFDARLVAGFVPFLTLYAILLHANVPWGYGPLRYLVASPRFHRWHHTSEQEGLDRNFAGMFPWMDALFGTLYLPEGRQPARFGVLGETIPEGLLQQLLYPFRRRRPAVAPQT